MSNFDNNINEFVPCFNKLMRQVYLQAVNDLLTLRKSGVVKGMTVKQPFKKTKVLDNDYCHESDVKALLDFFNGNDLQTLIHLGKIPITVQKTRNL